MTYTSLIQVDELLRSDHFYLENTDECYFWGEYTARRGYGHSTTNQLVLNFKKPNTEKNKPSYHYKAKAIKEVAKLLEVHLGHVLSLVSLVPVPPSKAKNHPDYDDRLVQVLSLLSKSVKDVHFCELIHQMVSKEAVHLNADRPTPAAIKDDYRVEPSHLNDLRNDVIIFDDMLTTGSHFKAMQRTILEVKPDTNIIGLFIARRAPESDFI